MATDRDQKPRPLQLFPLKRVGDQSLSVNEIAQFLEDFQQIMGGNEGKRKAISLRVPEGLLRQFQVKAGLGGYSYQAKIVDLMRQWVKGKSTRRH